MFLFLKKLQYKTDRLSWENDIREAYEELEEMTIRVINGFSAYGSKLLGLRENEDGVYSEILEFLGSVSCTMK